MEFSSALFLAAIGALMVYGVVVIQEFLARRKAMLDLGCQQPPSIPQQDPFFGLDLALQSFKSMKENRRNMSMKEQFEVHGRTFQSKPYGKTIIFTIEPRNLQAVLGTDFTSWGVQPMRLFGFEPFVGKGIMCSDGAFWEHSRALIKPTFARTQIADLHLNSYAIHVQKLIDCIPRDSSTIDLQPLFGRLALDSSTEFLFGESVGSLEPDTVSIDARSFLEAFNYGQQGVGRRLHLPKWNFLTYDKKFKESCEIAREFVDGYISKALVFNEGSKVEKSSKPERYVLTHELLKETKNREDVRNQLLNVFLPAHDATGVALTNVFFNLARNPATYAKLRREILNAEGDQTDWTFERLKSLRYLQYVVNETFRLNPPIGTTTRMALRHTTLPTGGGPSSNSGSPIYIRKGDVVTFNFYALHRSQDLSGYDANLFVPERWETLRPAHWSYLPFGGGPRVCPGQQLALTEVGYTIVKILQAFKRIENRDPVMEFVEHYKITTESKNGAKVAFIPAAGASSKSAR